MKLYHLPVSDDAAGATLQPAIEHVVTAVGGEVKLSRSHGVGPAIFVITLPDAVSLEDVGLVDAKLVETVTQEESDEDSF